MMMKAGNAHPEFTRDIFNFQRFIEILMRGLKISFNLCIAYPIVLVVGGLALSFT